jgi:enoyl-CoA hydratase
MDALNLEPILLSGEGPIQTLTLNRPQALNSLTPDLLASLIVALEKLARRAELRVLIVRGAGEKSFVSGADIRTMADLGPRPIADYVELGQRALRAIETFPCPVLASVQGYALGGGLELALACDLIVASTNARLGQPEVNLGIIPGFGGTQRLMQRCGMAIARRLVFGGEILSAQEAFRLHLVDFVVEPAELEKETQRVASTIAEKAPLAVREAKRVLRQSAEPQLLSGLRLEVEAFLKLFGTLDREQAMQAFLEKKKFEFKGV